MTAITSEIERFNRLSATWWDSQGPMRPLHVVNALRLGHVVDQIARHTHKPAADALSGLRILDVGCGGGLMSEPLARRGAQVVGVDASPGNVAAARLHAQAQGVAVDYRLGEPAQVLASGERFDVVLALEVVEHVSDVPAFVNTVAQAVAPGGLLIASTIDRTWKSFVFAIVGAEYVLQLLPKGTHEYAKFIKPSELAGHCRAAGLDLQATRGMEYNPLTRRYWLSGDTSVNYMFSTRKAAA